MVPGIHVFFGEEALMTCLRSQCYKIQTKSQFSRFLVYWPLHSLKIHLSKVKITFPQEITDFRKITRRRDESSTQKNSKQFLKMLHPEEKGT